MKYPVLDYIKKEFDFEDYDVEDINSLNFEEMKNTYHLNDVGLNYENLPFYVIRFKKIFRNLNLTHMIFATKINNEFINYINNRSSYILNPNAYSKPSLDFDYESKYIHNRQFDRTFCFDKEFGACEKDYFLIKFDNKKSLIISDPDNYDLLEIEVLKKFENGTLYILFKMYYDNILRHERSVIYYDLTKFTNIKNLNLNKELKLFLKPFLIDEKKLNINFKIERNINNPEFIYYYNEELKPLIEVVEY